MKLLNRRLRRVRLPTALLAQSDFELRSSFAHALDRAAYHVTECTTASELLGHIESSPSYDVIVCDLRWLDAINVLGGFGAGWHHSPLVLIDTGKDATDARPEDPSRTVVIRPPFDLMKNVALFRAMAAARDPIAAPADTAN